MSGSSLQPWLERVRRRIRARRSAIDALWATCVWGGVSMVVLVIARIVALGWERRAVWILLVPAALAGAVWGATRRLPLTLVARAADRDLRGHDRVATANEIGDAARADIERLQTSDAQRWAHAHPASRAAPFRVPRRALVLAAGLGAAVVLLSIVPNPMDDVVRQRELEARLVEEAARELDERAEAAKEEELSPEAERRLVEELQALAKELREQPSLEKALEALERAEARLAASRTGASLATKTLMANADRALAMQPLVPAAPPTLAAQLDALANGEATTGELQRATKALEQLASSLQATDPALAAALADAAAAAAAGDASALSDASQALTAVQADLAAQDALAAAAASLGDLRSALAAAASGEGKGEGAGLGLGEGSGRSPGAGQSGQQGQQAGSGGQAGTNAPFGSPATGGSAQPNGTGNNASDPAGAPVYDPIFGSEVAERLRVQGNRTGGRSQIVGFDIGPGRRNPILVPYRYVYSEWAARAARSIEVLTVPASTRALVREYFNSLAP